MRQVRAKVTEVGAIDWDRRLFDELIPLPDGTTYNSYLVKGSEKTALIDSVDPTKMTVLIDNLVKSGIDKLDYVVSQHAEQDHSGAIPDVLLLYPEAKVVTNKRCKEMLMDLLEIGEERFITVEDGEKLSLGDLSLEFVFTPWVHWPETMCTYLREEKILFSCDFFGSHYAGSSLFVADEPTIYEAAKRYYAEIMMPFRTTIRKNMEKLKAYPIEVIATSHGPVYDGPEFIMEAYRDWASDEVKNEVVVAYVSMHGSVRKMVEHFTEALMAKGVTVKQFDLTGADVGKLAISMVDAATIVLGAPTVLSGAHPTGAAAASLVNALRPKAKFASIIGSYGWGARTVEQIKGLLTGLKAEIIEPVMAKGLPKEKDYAALTELAGKIAAKHKDIGILKE